MKRSILIITGPTAVGKTDIALGCAAKIPAEIINADVGQMYEPLTIGTAKPDWRSLTVPHHGFDILTQPKDYTVVAYREYVQALCQEIWSRNKLPILVGGSLFYIKSLFFPPQVQSAAMVLPDMPLDCSWDILHKIDPVRAQAIHPHDSYRIKRALAVWHATNTLPSTLSLTYAPFAHAHLVFLTRDRAQLYQRINDRVVQMFAQGFLDEVSGLQGTDWEPFLKQKKFIGYNDILMYLNQPSGDFTYERLIQTIQQKTRHYAKRQQTFWRMLAEQLAHAHDTQYAVTTSTADLTMYDYDLYISHLLAQLQSHLA